MEARETYESVGGFAAHPVSSAAAGGRTLTALDAAVLKASSSTTSCCGSSQMWINMTPFSIRSHSASKQHCPRASVAAGRFKPEASLLI